MAIIRALVPADAEAYVRLRGEALLQDPMAFGASPGDDVASSVDFMRSALTNTDQATFGAFAPGLVGIVGILRERHAKRAHKATLWGLYVTRAHRGRGLGRRLCEAAIDFARSIDGVDRVQLGVTVSNRAAATVYEHLGFIEWGVEPAALRVANRDVAERHMVLVLARSCRAARELS